MERWVSFQRFAYRLNEEVVKDISNLNNALDAAGTACRSIYDESATAATEWPSVSRQLKSGRGSRESVALKSMELGEQLRQVQFFPVTVRSL